MPQGTTISCSAVVPVAYLLAVAVLVPEAVPASKEHGIVVGALRLRQEQLMGTAAALTWLSYFERTMAEVVKLQALPQCRSCCGPEGPSPE